VIITIPCGTLPIVNFPADPSTPILRSAKGYLLNNFFFAADNSLSFDSSTSGYARSSEARASMTAAATTTRVNHLLSAGTTYHGACFVVTPFGNIKSFPDTVAGVKLGQLMTQKP